MPFYFVLFLKSERNKLIIMIIMINITTTNKYPLKKLVPKKLKLPEINIDHNINQNQ